jgi:hypothetical protein
VPSARVCVVILSMQSSAPYADLSLVQFFPHRSAEGFRRRRVVLSGCVARANDPEPRCARLSQLNPDTLGGRLHLAAC